jgi:hypothetical protein
MAVVTTKSTRISNAESVSQILDSVVLNQGRLRTVVGTIEAANGDSIGSKFVFCRLRSDWRAVSIKLYCDAITSGAGDIGLYQTSANPNNGGAVAAVACYASAQSIASASVTGIECAYEAKDIANCQRQVWQDAGASADTQRWYDLVMTLTAATTAAGTVTLEVTYAGND